MDHPTRTSPLLAGLTLVGVGLLVRQWQPALLDLPEPDNHERKDRGMRRVARKTRDGLASVLPGNLTGSIARSLMIMGAGLIMVRLLDSVVDDREAFF